MIISITIPIVPRGTGRPRATIRGGHATTYKAAADREHHSTMASYMAAHPGRPQSPLEGPVYLRVEVYLPRPKSAPKRDPGALRCGHRPDVDNVVKGIMDALMQAGWIHDDGQVWCLEATKLYHELGGVPRYEITLEESRDDRPCWAPAGSVDPGSGCSQVAGVPDFTHGTGSKEYWIGTLHDRT
jgi:Holliday junction resolvase RusA-like endonuclease